VNNSRFTIPTGYGGKWLFTAVSGFDPLTAGNMILRFYVNGSSIGLAIFTGNTNAGTLTSTSITNVLNLVAGDYVQLFIYQNSGVAATTMVSGAEDFTFMNCSFIGA
jgi:capsid portal protein